MMEKRYVIGVDFGTLSARALLLDGLTGQTLATADMNYPHAVMDTALPCGTPLPERWALQHPADYVQALGYVIREAVKKGGIKPEEVGGVGLDFTACTLLALDGDGVPLCMKEKS